MLFEAKMILREATISSGLTTMLQGISAIRDTDNAVKIVIDEDVLKETYYGCSDGTTTGYLKIETEKIVNVFLPFVCYEPAVIKI